VLEVGRVVGTRALALVPVLIGVSLLTFGLMNLLPGGPVEAMLSTGATQETINALTHQLHLDQPWPARYVEWIAGALHGDLGTSYSYNLPVVGLLSQRLPVTLELIVISQVIAVAIAIPLGIVGGYRIGTAIDQLLTTATFVLVALPPFVLALVLILILAVKVGLFPAAGFVSPNVSLAGNLQSVALPSLTLALGSMAIYQRVLRSEIAGTLQEEFIAVARAKGLSVRRILLVHALRPSSLPLVTVLGLTIGNLIGGAIVVEQIFGLPGVGTMLVNAIANRDYITVQGAVLVIAVGFVAINLVIDASYAVLDPRVRKS
jgi:peptide/nickel transport system permease protein